MAVTILEHSELEKLIKRATQEGFIEGAEFVKSRFESVAKEAVTNSTLLKKQDLLKMLNTSPATLQRMLIKTAGYENTYDDTFPKGFGHPRRWRRNDIESWIDKEISKEF